MIMRPYTAQGCSSLRQETGSTHGIHVTPSVSSLVGLGLLIPVVCQCLNLLDPGTNLKLPNPDGLAFRSDCRKYHQAHRHEPCGSHDREDVGTAFHSAPALTKPS